MHLDVLDLRQFYYRTRLGRIAQKSVRDQVVAMWPDARGEVVVGFGFAAPLMRPYLGQAARVLALMPGAQGVMPWPPEATFGVAVATWIPANKVNGPVQSCIATGML